MDPMLFWTAAVVVVTILGGVFKYFASGLERQMNELHNSVQNKLDKIDHQRSEQRLDKDVALLRSDQNSRLDRFEAKIDKLLDWIVDKK